MSFDEFSIIVTDIINQILDDDIGFIVKRGSNLITGFGENSIALSSIDYVDLLVNLENRFDIYFDFDVKIETVGDIYEYITRFEETHNSNMVTNDDEH